MTGQEDRQVLYWVSVNLPVGIHSQCQPPPLLFHPLYPFFFFNPCHLLRVCPTDGGCAGQLVLSFRKGSRFHRHVALAGCRYILVGNIARRSIQLQSIIHNNDSVFFDVHLPVLATAAGRSLLMWLSEAFCWCNCYTISHRRVSTPVPGT